MFYLDNYACMVVLYKTIESVCDGTSLNIPKVQ